MLYVNPLASPYAARTAWMEGGRTKEKVALKELDQLFVYTLVREMRKTTSGDSILGGSREEEIFQEMLDDSLSAAIAESGQMGMAKAIEAQLRAMEAMAKAGSEAMAGQERPLQA